VPTLTLHGRPVLSVFDLLCRSENDIIYSVGWDLANSPIFLAGLIESVYDNPPAKLGEPTIKLQQYEPGTGITDIEINLQSLQAIVEAERGWWIPSLDQLEKYRARLSKDLNCCR